MKRKLIDFDAFQRLQLESLSNVEQELSASAPLLAETLGLDGLALNTYGPEDVLFESLDGEFVHATYQVKNGFVQFDNIEQLVLNEESEVNKAREVISNMLDSLIESNEAKAEEFFNEWMDLPRTKRVLNEAKVKRVVCRKNSKGKEECSVRKWENRPKHHEPGNVTAKRMKGKKISFRKKSPSMRNALKLKRQRLNRAIGKNMKEWTVIAENVLNYVDLTQNGPALNQCQTLRKEGEIVSVKVPTIKLQNEAKMLKFNWKTMNTDVVIKRGQSKRLSENQEFAQVANELRKATNLSDNKALEESLEKATTKFPEAIYLTENELAYQVKSALESVNASNYDDETCRFIAEGLLRTIHDTYVDRVAKIVRLAGASINESSSDKYAEFKHIAETFYKQLDEQSELEMQAFVDVYEALRNVYELAVNENNETVASGTAAHLDDLLSMIKQEAELSLDTLAEAAEWLYDIVESTMGEEWKVEAPVVNADGEHPDLAKKGRFSQSPADMQGSTPEAHHTSDGKVSPQAAKELANDGWSNIGGEGVYPSLDNPYVPKAGEYKIVGEKDVDSDSDQLAQWGGNETWPNLSNPYSKASVTPDSVKE